MWRSYKLFCDTQLANVNFFEPYEVKLCICWTRSPAANMLRPPFPSESIDEKPSIWGAHRTIFALLLRLNVTKCSFFPYPTIATAHIPSNTPILLPQIRASIANSAPRATEQRIRHEKPTAERECASPRTAKSNVEHSRVRTYFYRYGLRGAHSTFLRSKSWRLSLKTSLFLSKSPQLSRKSADVFLFTPRRSFSRRQFRGQTPSLSSENRAPQQVGWESGNVCLAVRRGIRKFAAN